VLADSGRALRQGHNTLPRSALSAVGIQHCTVAAITGSAAAHTLLRTMLDDCLAGIQRMQHPPVPALHPLAIQARITAARLVEIRRDGYRVLERSVDITPLRRLWLSLRTYYGARLNNN
jgi:phytoene/squalene synthetase